ncbi:MAG: hypothetical protein HC871_09625 [Rhizobiales bacterium]|nr:hypothetical protein [Hyphomicrobiales bacterium]
MPVFINEVVFHGDIQRAPDDQGPAPGVPAGIQFKREALVAEVTQAVMDYLERELDRIGER